MLSFVPLRSFSHNVCLLWRMYCQLCLLHSVAVSSILYSFGYRLPPSFWLGPDDLTPMHCSLTQNYVKLHTHSSVSFNKLTSALPG
uniref:Secreted protein n=1 Tax=Pyxicephalus adspersus TaxID=30357 RepID=A0AAV3A9M6_PYXAD|nr:TPA: hypothetical protein GDO54_013302 [Pyxicephalus adspersus]